MKIKLEKNVPIPDNGIGKCYGEALAKMKVGESFEYPAKHYQQVNIQSLLFKAANKTVLFTSKGTGQSLRRIWRIK